MGGNRIVVVAAGVPAPRTGETVIDGRGGTLMPGLIEPHAHLGFADVGSYDLTRLPPEEHLLADLTLLQNRNAIRMIMKDGSTRRPERRPP